MENVLVYPIKFQKNKLKFMVVHDFYMYVKLLHDTIQIVHKWEFYTTGKVSGKKMIFFPFSLYVRQNR